MIRFIDYSSPISSQVITLFRKELSLFDYLINEMQ